MKKLYTKYNPVLTTVLVLGMLFVANFLKHNMALLFDVEFVRTLGFILAMFLPQIGLSIWFWRRKPIWEQAIKTQSFGMFLKNNLQLYFWHLLLLIQMLGFSRYMNEVNSSWYLWKYGIMIIVTLLCAALMSWGMYRGLRKKALDASDK